MSLNASLVDPLDIECPDPGAFHSKSSFSCYQRLRCDQKCWDRLSWCISMCLSLLGVIMALMGLVTDVSTIYTYFSNGDRDWGIIAAVFTGLGWTVFAARGVRDARQSGGSTGLASDAMKGISARTYGILMAFQLAPTTHQLDAAATPRLFLGSTATKRQSVRKASNSRSTH